MSAKSSRPVLPGPVTARGLPVSAVTAEDGSTEVRFGDVILGSGETLHDTRMVVRTFGEPNRACSNAVVIPTSFGARHGDFEWMVGADSIFDPARHFIVIANLLGNGLSTSPSNSEAFADSGRFPRVTTLDNAELQKRLLEELFGVRRIEMAIGWSMGGQTAYHLAACYPSEVRKLVPICASARTAQHNLVFLEGVRAVLGADCAFDPSAGWFTRPPERALAALARFYAGWALSQDFYRAESWRALGYASLEDFIARYWEAGFAGKDANNLLAQIATWQSADIGAIQAYGGDYERALSAIRARVLVMPGNRDLYFPVADSRIEVSLLRNAELEPIPSAWGHRAGNPVTCPADRSFITRHVRAFLERQ